MSKFVALVGLALSTTLWISSASADATQDKIRDQLMQLDANIPIRSIEAIDLPGFYAVSLASGEVLYVDETAQFIVSGDLLRVTEEGGLVNLTEERLRGFRMEEMAKVSDSEMIIYPAATEKKARIFVFTDVDCPYCRKLHEEVPALSEMGVEVAYLAFPRSGPETPTAINMASIWCAGDADAQRAALDAAKTGSSVDDATCENPVIAQLMLGQQLGVTGTPAIILENGRLLPGYMPAAKLGQALGL